MENTTNTNSPNTQPNIIFITVDQMRFPMNLPPGAPTPDQFVEKYMPNLHRYLWKDGVKFSNYYTAASDCTAARATIYTGLYGYQTYSMVTLTTYPTDPPPYKPRPDQLKYQPQLDPAFPTIGHLMRAAGYDTPYFGKWHLSYDASDLEAYGFNSHTPPEDYVGYQGQGLEDDDIIASDAAQWVTDRWNSRNQNPKPYFFAVNFVNPHDKQWYWGGMQANNFNNVYKSIPETPVQTLVEIYGEDNPPSYGYSTDINHAIPNWQNQDELAAKPQTQRLIKEVFQYQMGGIYEDDESSTYMPVTSPAGFYYAPTNLHQGKHKAIAPKEYWTKALNSYIQVMGMVDNAIGIFMAGIPDEVRKNSIFILTSDHGEYGSSHGLQGKGGTVYDEGILVPLLVSDPSGIFFSTPANPYREQLTSSVDLLRMIVSMGHRGSLDWMTGDYKQMYATRCDLLNILRDPKTPGRLYALHSTDEFIPDANNYFQPPAPLHVIGLIKDAPNPAPGTKQKLGIYTLWDAYNPQQTQATVLFNDYTQKEYYDHSIEPNERTSTPDSPGAQKAIGELFGGTAGSPDLLHTELQAPLPAGAYQDAQTRAYRALQNYMAFVNSQTSKEQANPEVVQEREQRLARAWAF